MSTKSRHAFFTTTICLFALGLAAAGATRVAATAQSTTTTTTTSTTTSTTSTTTSSPAAAPAVTVALTDITDIPGGAPNATLQQAAQFAWQEFINLNWPAKSGVRDTADPTQRFGTGSGPLVWHTYRAKVEIFPGNGYAKRGPHGYSNPPNKPNGPDYGYDDPPQYVYSTRFPQGDVKACTGQTPVATPAWINLDEISQIALNSMYAGVVPSASTATNSQPQLIRFMAKANGVQYKYVAANQYWYNNSSAPLARAKSNFATAVTKTPPVAPTAPFVSFPAGTIETKAAWRRLAPNEDAARFYTTTVRYYESSPTVCYREDQWALIALHIIQKTPTAPAFTFATFEQADNILLPKANAYGDPVPVEDDDGNIVNTPTPASPTSPALLYVDTPPPVGPQVAIDGSTYCTSPGLQLFYRNTPGLSGLPAGGNICVNQRDNPIPWDVIAVNRAAHTAIRAYNAANKIADSPWLHYKLVNVQSSPFDKSQIDRSNPDGVHNPATFFQANIVVETNYTLQLFHGRVATNGAPTDYPTASAPPPPNVYTFNGTKATGVNMGGCMGCHGNAQVAGADFSFILNEGRVQQPEAPSVSRTTLKAKYLANFATTKK
ncbi:MAG TPA: hypothetical protein VFN10_04855 [Thermoanaerobaculia bacterium]|nr:hypothetical protein [Thermoanaerobaculia bacterium]